jgi:hypothetical protein
MTYTVQLTAVGTGGKMKKALSLMAKVVALVMLFAVLGGCSLFSHWALQNHSSHIVSVYLLDNSLEDGRTVFDMSPGQTEELKKDSMPSLLYAPANLVSATADLGDKTVTFNDL